MTEKEREGLKAIMREVERQKEIEMKFKFWFSNIMCFASFITFGILYGWLPAILIHLMIITSLTSHECRPYMRKLSKSIMQKLYPDDRAI